MECSVNILAVCFWLIFMTAYLLNVYIASPENCSPLTCLCLSLCSQLQSPLVSGHGTTPPWAFWPRNLWVWLPSLLMEFLTWTGPLRSWRSRRDASMTSPTYWRGSSSSERSPRTTSSGCEYQWRRWDLIWEMAIDMWKEKVSNLDATTYYQTVWQVILINE